MFVVTVIFLLMLRNIHLVLAYLNGDKLIDNQEGIQLSEQHELFCSTSSLVFIFYRDYARQPLFA